MNDGADEEAGKRKGKRLPTKASKGRATSDPASTCSSVQGRLSNPNIFRPCRSTAASPLATLYIGNKLWESILRSFVCEACYTRCTINTGTHYSQQQCPPSLPPSPKRIRTGVDAAVALADGDAQSLARFFRGLLPSSAKNGGPQHVCLKHAFVLLDRRWSVDKTFPTATADGADPPPLMFGKKESLLSPELFANIVSFLNPNHALRTTSTCKAWWRNGEI